MDDSSEGTCSSSELERRYRMSPSRPLISRVLVSLMSLEQDLEDLQTGLSTLRRQLEDTTHIVEELAATRTRTSTGNQRGTWTGPIGRTYLSGAHIAAERLVGNDPGSLARQRRVLAWKDLSKAEQEYVLHATWGADSEGLPP